MATHIKSSHKFKSTEDLLDYFNKTIKPSFNIDISPDEWALPNRNKFVNWLDKTFKYSKSSNKPVCDCSEEECKIKKLDLFPHQKFIKDYIQYKSPYRGVLLFHGLGSGKSASSIAAAELLSNHMEVVVMVPASIRSNYMDEIKKYGNTFYNTNSHWSFVSIDNFDPTIISKFLKLDIKIINKLGGIWISDSKLKPNFSTLDDTFKDNIKSQLNNIIENKFHFINYNGLRKSAILAWKGVNPFSNKCVVIDEVHNLVSRMVNKRDIGYAINKLLMEATNCKLILLSGTPIINYPYEISYLINLIIGYKTKFTLNATVNSSFDVDVIKSILDKFPQIDFYEIDQNNRKISYLLLPEGFQHNNNLVSRTEHKFDQHKLIDDFYKQNFIFHKKITEENIKILPEDEELFNKYFIDNNNSIIKNPNLFMRRILGTVSFYNKFSEELFPKLEIIEVPVVMTPFQFTEYETSRKDEIKKEINAKNKRAKGAEVSTQYRFYSRAKCNFVFPKEVNRPFPSKITMLKGEVDDVDNTFINKFEKDNLLDINFNKEYTRLIKECLTNLKKGDFLNINNIGKYSPKFSYILNEINKLNGTAMIYSQFRTVEGLGIFGLVLETNGYARFTIKQNEDKQWDIENFDDIGDKPTFFEYTGNNEETQIVKDIFNSNLDNLPPLIKKKLEKYDDNIRGSIIKILMITQSGAEGISLKNVRQVHIIEPYWNYVRINQVIGRAVRTCSHLALPPKDRNVTCFIYYCIFSDKQIKESFTIRTKDKSNTTDQYIYNIAKRKNTIIVSLLDLLKKSSIDCALNKNENCFTIPSNLPPNNIIYDLNMAHEILDSKQGITKISWSAEILKTKKGNFMIRIDTNEVYDYDIYTQSNKLVKLGILEKIDGKRIIRMNLPDINPFIMPTKILSPVLPKSISPKSSHKSSHKSLSPDISPHKSSPKSLSPDISPHKSSDKSPESDEFNIGLLTNNKNSCYLDSILISLMHVPNLIIDNILNCRIKDYKIDKINNISIEVQKQLNEIYDFIHSGKNRMVCSSIRNLFNKFYIAYKKDINKKQEKINWLSGQQEPSDVIEILNKMFNLSHDTIYQETINKSTPNKVSALFNDFNIELSDLLNNKKININDYLPIHKSNFTNNNNRNINKTKEYLKSKGLFINIRRGYIEDHIEEKSFTSVYPSEFIKINNDTLYLMSMIIHYGDNIHSGHYISYIKHNDSWYIYDDTKDDLEYVGDFKNINKEIYNNVVSFVYIV
jgi:hypothetical protein